MSKSVQQLRERVKKVEELVDFDGVGASLEVNNMRNAIRELNGLVSDLIDHCCGDTVAAPPSGSGSTSFKKG